MGGAEGVSYMYDLLKGGGDAGESTVSQHGSEFGQGGDFEEGLDFVEGLAVGGGADAEAVVG